MLCIKFIDIFIFAYFRQKIPGFLLCSVPYTFSNLHVKKWAPCCYRYEVQCSNEGHIKIASFYKLLFVNQLTAHRLIQKKTFRHSFIVLDFQVLLPQTLCLWGVSLKGPKKLCDIIFSTNQCTAAFSYIKIWAGASNTVHRKGSQIIKSHIFSIFLGTLVIQL